MKINKPGEFANYCQERADDAGLPDVVDLADRWADFSDRLDRQYSGHGQGMDAWIEEAYKRMLADGVSISRNQLIQTREILTGFWEYGEAFDKWFKSKVIIVQQ